MQTERTMPLIIVGAAIILDGRVLACERAEPPEMSGKWEFPGGKVEPGEGETEALVRECQEELGIVVEVGARVGGDITLSHGNAILKVYRASLTNGRQPTPLEHSDLRWLSADDLYSVPWLPADAPIVDALKPLLTA